MGPLFLAFLAFIVVFTLVMYLVSRWAGNYIQKHITARLKALEQIVNEDQVPEAWLSVYRRRAAKLQASGATDAQIRGLSGIARKKCLANIQELIRFVDARSLADTDETERLMLTSLREHEAAWQVEETWHQIVDLTAPPPPPEDDSDGQDQP